MASTPSQNITVQLLRLIRRASRRQEEITISELIYKLGQDQRGRFSGIYRYYIDDGAMSARSLERMGNLLRELEELGLVEVSSFDEITGSEKWTASVNWLLSDNGHNGDDGGDDDPPNGSNNNGDDQNDEGSGLAEVLSHPLLFSLDQEGFGDLVDKLFENEEK